MQSVIVIGANSKTRKVYIKKRFDEENIKAVDRTFIESDMSIGISVIRDFQKKANLKPIAGHTKAICILNAQNLTIEAQNAMLKILEEPPVQTLIFLSAENDESFLPTVISRCQIVKLGIKTKVLNDKEKKEYFSFWKNILKTNPINRLLLIPDLGKKRENYQIFLQNHILFVHDWLVETIINKDKNNDISIYQIAQLLKNLHKTQSHINANCNTKLAFDQLFLNNE